MDIDDTLVDVDQVQEDVSDEAVLSKEFLKDVIVSVAESTDVNEWDDIRLIDTDGPIAWADIEERAIFLNVGSSDFPNSMMPVIMGGLLAHEKGHLEGRLSVPGSEARFKDQMDETAERLKPHIPSSMDEERMAKQLLNLCQDWEIHYQILQNDYFAPSVQSQVRQFVNKTRGHLADQDHESLVLCQDIQATDKQQEAKEVVERRDLSVIDKAVEIAKIMDFDDEDEDNKSSEGQGDDSDGDEEERSRPSEDVSDDGSDGNGDSGSDGSSGDGPDGQQPGDESADSEPDGEQDTSAPGQGGKSDDRGTPDISPITSVGSPTDDRDDQVDTSGAGVSIQEHVREVRDISRVSNRLQELGMSPSEARSMIEEHDNKRLKEHISTLDNVLEDVIPSLQSAETGGSGDRSRPRGNSFDGYRAPIDPTEMADSPVDLLTVGQVSRDQVKVERRVRRRDTSGVVFILRDTSRSMLRGDNAKLARDTTVSLIKTAQEHDHDVGVIDFSGEAMPHHSSDGEVLSKDYHKLMVQSMELKAGGGTELKPAIDVVNRVVEENNLESVPLNIYVVTDSEIAPQSFELVSNDPKLNTVWTHSRTPLYQSMRDITEKYGGDIFRVRDTGEDEMLAEIYESY